MMPILIQRSRRMLYWVHSVFCIMLCAFLCIDSFHTQSRLHRFGRSSATCSSSASSSPSSTCIRSNSEPLFDPDTSSFGYSSVVQDNNAKASFGDSLTQNWLHGINSLPMSYTNNFCLSNRSRRYLYCHHYHFPICIFYPSILLIGVCKHENIFEATTDIRQIKFSGNTLALAMTDGRCCMVDIASGEMIDKFNAHDNGKYFAIDIYIHPCIALVYISNTTTCMQRSPVLTSMAQALQQVTQWVLSIFINQTHWL